MPMTEKQKTQWFVAHPLNGETGPRRAAVHDAIDPLRAALKEIDAWCVGHGASPRISRILPIYDRPVDPGVLDGLRQTVRDLALVACEAIDTHVPSCADATFAQRQVRLAAMIADDMLVEINLGAAGMAMIERSRHAERVITEAAMWADMAIATGGA